jgi:hypothetical protein
LIIDTSSNNLEMENENENKSKDKDKDKKMNRNKIINLTENINGNEHNTLSNVGSETCTLGGKISKTEEEQIIEIVMKDDVSNIPKNILQNIPKNVPEESTQKEKEVEEEEEGATNQRLSRAQFLIFLDIFVKSKLNENKNKNEKKKENKEKDIDKDETQKSNVPEKSDEKSSKLLTENLSDCSVRCFKEYSILIGISITNYQSVYFSRLAGAIIRDSGNLKNHSEEERNNFNVFLNSESGSKSAPGTYSSPQNRVEKSTDNNDINYALNKGENNSDIKSNHVNKNVSDIGDVCGCENRVKPFPSFSEGIKVLEFFSGIGYASAD